MFIDVSPIPASLHTICQYVAFSARSLKFTSISNYLNIIALLHKEFGLTNPLTDNWAIKSLLTGVKRAKASTVKQKLPITIDILLGIFNIINLHNSFDASFWPICLISFYGLFRKSHLLPISGNKFDPQTQLSQSSFKFQPWGMLIVVVWSKTIQFRECTVHIPIPYIHNSPLCPVSSLKHAMSFTYSAPPLSHAFSYYDLEHLQIRCFTYKQFLSKLRSCLSILGYPPDDYTGHSFRRGGGASFAFSSGVPIELIKILGDWKSDAVLLYLTVPQDIRIRASNLIAKSIQSFTTF